MISKSTISSIPCKGEYGDVMPGSLVGQWFQKYYKQTNKSEFVLKSWATKNSEDELLAFTQTWSFYL